MTTLLSFIGTGLLHDTIYLLEPQEYHTSIVQEALCKYYYPEKVILFVTKGARSKNLPAVLNALSSFNVKVVDIPDGKDEEEIWEIFSIVTESVSDNEDIIFDITHGFRSLPFIALLSIAYLKDVRNITLSGVVYGAFEAGIKIKTESGAEITRAPIFDLSGFVSIFDWMAGVRSFLYHADASVLKEQVKKISDDEFKKRKSRAGTQPLLGLIGPLSTYAEAVRLSRPVEAISAASLIKTRFPEARSAIGSYTPALSPLIGKISDIESFAVSGETKVLTDEIIRKQRNLIHIQLEMGLYQQAVTLGREWMVTVFLFYVGDGEKWLDKNTRYKAENTLSEAEGILRERKGENVRSSDTDKNFKYLDWFTGHKSFKELTGIWSKVSQIRNELAHCGMNPDSLQVQTLLYQVKKFSESLDRFYALFQ